jgi:hypothetical protein
VLCERVEDAMVFHWFLKSVILSGVKEFALRIPSRSRKTPCLLALPTGAPRSSYDERRRGRQTRLPKTAPSPIQSLLYSPGSSPQEPRKLNSRQAVKKWIITILLAATLLALAVATHFWGARIIKFAIDNDKTVDALKKLLELLLAIAGIVPPIVKVLFGNREKDSKAATATTNSQAGHDVNTAARDVQTGGTRAERDLKVDGNLISQQTNIYQAAPPAPIPTLSSLHQLPPPPADFTGRTTELAELRAAIEKGGIHISGLQGQGGVGKTALALKLAEELSPNYPDAQIYLDLKGVSEKPSPPPRPCPTSSAPSIPNSSSPKQ